MYDQNTDWFTACEDTKQAMVEIKEMTHKLGIELLIVLVPPQYQVSNHNWDVLNDLGYVLDENLLSDDELQEKMLTFCKEESLECIDLLPELRISEDPLYFIFDIHFNKEGHKKTAEILYPYLINTSKTI